MAKSLASLFKTEDYWAIWLGLGVVFLTLAFFWAGATIKPYVVVPGEWKTFSDAAKDLAANYQAYILLFLGLLAVLTASAAAMGVSPKHFMPGFVVLFFFVLLVFYLAGWTEMKRLDLGAPLLALAFGLLLGNILPIPSWLRPALRTEYYIKTGIVLLGATLPLTLIAKAGPIAFIQATIVSVTTFLTIYLAATRLFGLDPRFGAVLGTGGAVCGVSGSIAVGGAVKAEKEHISIAITVVSIWAIAMIFVLAFVTKAVTVTGEPSQWWQLSPGEAGAWVGTSEYADAAGLAVVVELSKEFGDAPLHAFTLMKVIGRDIWIGIWALILSIISVTYWEKQRLSGPTGRVGISVIWQRFPKFVLGFLAASVVMSIVAALPGEMPADASGAATGDWYDKVLKPAVIEPIKKLRDWFFVFSFLCIGLSTRFKELATFGLRPFWAFTIGVLVNIPLGYFLTTKVFSSYWQAIQ